MTEADDRRLETPGSPDGGAPEATTPDDDGGDGAPGSALSEREEVILGELLEDLPPGDPARNGIRRAIFRSHRGPIPSPEVLRAYNDISPAVLQEVLDGARENRQHRYAMDRKLVNTARLSLVLSAICVVVGLVIAVILGLNGHEVLAGIFGAGGLAPIVIAMLRGGGDWRGRGQRPALDPSDPEGHGAP